MPSVQDQTLFNTAYVTLGSVYGMTASACTLINIYYTVLLLKLFPVSVVMVAGVLDFQWKSVFVFGRCSSSIKYTGDQISLLGRPNESFFQLILIHFCHYNLITTSDQPHHPLSGAADRMPQMKGISVASCQGGFTNH